MSDNILNYLTPRQRKARTEAFKYMAYKWRQKEKESGKKVSKNVRRRICLEMDLEIYSRAGLGSCFKCSSIKDYYPKQESRS